MYPGSRGKPHIDSYARPNPTKKDPEGSFMLLIESGSRNDRENELSFAHQMISLKAIPQLLFEGSYGCSLR